MRAISSGGKTWTHCLKVSLADGVHGLKPEGGFEPWSNSSSFEIMVSETQLIFCSWERSCTEFLPGAVISCSEVYALEAKEGKELKGKIYRDICHVWQCNACLTFEGRCLLLRLQTFVYQFKLLPKIARGSKSEPCKIMSLWPACISMKESKIPDTIKRINLPIHTDTCGREC